MSENDIHTKLNVDKKHISDCIKQLHTNTHTHARTLNSIEQSHTHTHTHINNTEFVDIVDDEPVTEKATVDLHDVLHFKS